MKETLNEIHIDNFFDLVKQNRKTESRHSVGEESGEPENKTLTAVM